MRRSQRYTIAAVLMGLLTIPHLQLLGTILGGRGTEPALLVLGHTIALMLAAAAAIACWRQRSWAWALVLGYGIAVACVVLSLALLLPLPGDAWPGLLLGAAAMLIIATLGASYLRRGGPSSA